MFQIIKNGTACHFNEKGINYKTLERFAGEVEKMKKDQCIDTLIVASGSIKLGMLEEGETRTKEELDNFEKQGYASVGQPILVNLYKKIFNKNIAQILPTRADLKKSDYVKKLIHQNREKDRISVVNYDDCLDFEQINKDNDTLASSLAVYSGADRLILLGHYEGLVDNKNNLVTYIEKITDKHKSYCNGKSDSGNGGFETKLLAAKEVTQKGIPMYIGNINKPLEEVVTGPMHTYFAPEMSKVRDHHRSQTDGLLA
ncbi:MAG: hypothetical protein ACOCQG_02230, partial [Candidatus Nanoarchaeia archaeon]